MAAVRQSWPRANEEKNEIFLRALRKAYEAGFTEAVHARDDSERFSDVLEQKIEEIDFWAFDVREEKEEAERERNLLRDKSK